VVAFSEFSTPAALQYQRHGLTNGERGDGSRKAPPGRGEGGVVGGGMIAALIDKNRRGSDLSDSRF